MCRKRVKVQKYKDIAVILYAKKLCRKMYNKYKRLDFVINDDKYFGLTSFKMSGNSKKKLEPGYSFWP